jgi:hypothetical protein
MKLIFIFLSVLLSSSLWAQTSYVAPTKTLNEKGYQLGVEADIFTTSKRIDQDGDDVSFESGEKFSRTQAEISGYYGLLSNLQIGGGARFRQNASTSLNLTTSELEDETSTGIQSTFATLMYAFKPVDRLRYVMEGTFRYTPYNNEESVPGGQQANLILGDQGNEVSGGLTGRVGLRQPGDELSSEIYWQVEGAMVWQHVALIAGVNGISSMNNDPNEDDPINKPQYYTGSTALYNSTNREMIAPYVGANLAMGKNWRVEFKGSQVVSGTSTDIGTGFSVALIRRADIDKSVTPDKTFKRYDFEGTITKVSAKKKYVVIDKGVGEDVRKGMKIDFYEFDYVGGNFLIARGTVISVKSDTSIVKITTVYNTKKVLKEGIVARGSFR